MTTSVCDFPRALVEDLITKSRAKEYPLYAPNPEERSSWCVVEEVLFSTSGEAVSVLDYDTQSFRPTKLTDLYDATRLGDQLEHIHNFGQPFIAAEYSHDVFVHDVNIAYAELAGTDKSFALGIAVVEHIDVHWSNCSTPTSVNKASFSSGRFVHSAAARSCHHCDFGEENAQVLVRVAELGLVADIAVAPQAGATAPAALAGTLVQCFAETLACLCVVNLVNPGTPINFGMWPFISDLRTGSFSGGSGEEASDYCRDGTAL